jgi:hypothetical protein
MNTMKPRIRTSHSREEVVRELERAGLRVIDGHHTSSQLYPSKSNSSIVGIRTKPLVIKY